MSSDPAYPARHGFAASEWAKLSTQLQQALLDSPQGMLFHVIAGFEHTPPESLQSELEERGARDVRILAIANAITGYLSIAALRHVAAANGVRRVDLVQRVNALL